MLVIMKKMMISATWTVQVKDSDDVDDDDDDDNYDDSDGVDLAAVMLVMMKMMFSATWTAKEVKDLAAMVTSVPSVKASTVSCPLNAKLVVSLAPCTSI